MTFMPNANRGRAALAALALCVSTLPATAAPGGDAFRAALEALKRNDGIAAEVELKRALDAGMPRDQIAAFMGQAEFYQGDFGDAHGWLDAGEFSSGTAAQGFHVLGLLNMAEGKFEAADRALQQALSSRGVTASIWVDVGRLRYMLGEHHQAVAASLRALEIDANDPRALEFRGQMVRDSKGMRSALPWFRKGLQKAPDDMSLLGEYAATLGELGYAKDMLKVTRRMLELQPGNPRAFYMQTVMAARAGDFGLARRLIWRAGNAFEGLPAATMLEGLLELRAGNSALAVEAFADLARQQPDNMRVQQLFGRALLENGETAEVLARFGPLADRAEASAYLLTLVGRAHEINGNREAAAPYLDRAVATEGTTLAPIALGQDGDLVLFRYRDDPMRLDVGVAQVRKLLNEGGAADARAAIDALGERFAGSADFEVLAGDVALASGDPNSALAHYRSAAEIRRTLALVKRMTAALERLDRAPEALLLAQDYLVEHPQQGDAARLFADLAARQGEWVKARIVLEFLDANGETVGDPQTLILLAIARLRTGAHAEALVAAERAYRLQRANGRVAYALALAMQANGGEEAVIRALANKARRLGAASDPIFAQGA